MGKGQRQGILASRKRFSTRDLRKGSITTYCEETIISWGFRSLGFLCRLICVKKQGKKEIRRI